MVGKGNRRLSRGEWPSSTPALRRYEPVGKPLVVRPEHHAADDGEIDNENQYVKSPMARSSRQATLLYVSDKKGLSK